MLKLVLDQIGKILQANPAGVRCMQVFGLIKNDPTVKQLSLTLEKTKELLHNIPGVKIETLS